MADLMARLLPVPDAPPRALGLIRVSKERDNMISPEIQRVAITDHAARRGYTIVAWVEGIDQSGSRAKSAWWPRLDQAIDRVVQRDVDVIVVWRFDRTARNRLRWAVALDRVDTAGGRLESATEPIDTSTASGRLARGMLGEFAAYRAEEIGANWRDAHAHRVARGLPANGKPRFGYAYIDGIHTPDPDTGPVLADLYRRYVAGESVYALVDWLNRQGYRTVAGYSAAGPGPWSQMTLRRTLDSGFGAGLITVRGEHRPAAHPAVIDQATWTAYRAARISRRTLRRADRSTYLLSGLMRCMHPLPDGTECDSPMGGGQYGHARQPKYRCLAVAQQRRHTGGYVTMNLVEAEVHAWLVQQDVDDVDVAANETAASRPVRARRRRDADALAREIVERERQLERLTVQHARGVVPEGAYLAARAEIEGERTLLEEQHARAVLTVKPQRARALAAELVHHWDGEALSMAERREMLRRLVQRVEVRPGRPRAAIQIIPN